MKKYFSGLVAILFAVTLYAFTAPKTASASSSDLYWYKTDPSGAFLIIDYGEVSRDFVLNETECEDNSLVNFCAKGYNEEQVLGEAPAENDVIMETHIP